MASSGLAGLPLELVPLIAIYLSTKELGALRLTSKGIEAALLDTFSREFFTKKQFMLTSPSLEALLGISKHPAFSKYFKHLIIGLERYDDRFWPPDPDKGEKYRRGQADQIILGAGHDRDMLAEAFRNLPNLETIGIRDYSATGRLRDGDARWRSYGAPTVQEETGVRLTSAPFAVDRHCARTYSKLILALADAGAEIQTIEVILRAPEAGLKDFAFCIPPYAASKVAPVLREMKKLLLTLNLSSEYSLRSQAFPGGQSVYLRDFLARTTNLEHLRLNFKLHQEEGPEEVLQWLGEPAGPLNNNPVPLPHLRCLDFGMLTIQSNTLTKVIGKFAPTLQDLSFWRVRMRYSHTNASCSSDPDLKPNPWRAFLSGLDKMPQLKLKNLLVGSLEQMDNSSRITTVLLKRDLRGGDGGSHVLEHTRDSKKEDMKVFLPQLIEDIAVQWPQTGDDGDSEDSGDMDDDMDEDEGEHGEE